MHRKDQIDLTVGLSDLPSVGDRLETGRVIARIHARGPIDADLFHAVERAITLSDQPVTPPPLIFQEVS
jgi:pyrimidine-nucleoside phosphorylase